MRRKTAVAPDHMNASPPTSASATGKQAREHECGSQGFSRDEAQELAVVPTTSPKFCAMGGVELGGGTLTTARSAVTTERSAASGAIAFIIEIANGTWV